MGCLLINEQGRTRQCLLKQSNMFGRHHDSSFIFGQNNKLPLYWLEVRWLKDSWYWRTLNKADQTIGTGQQYKDGWKKFSKTIRLQNMISLELISNEKPSPLIENITTKEKWNLVACNIPIQIQKGLYFWEDKELKNSSLFHHEGNSYRFWNSNEEYVGTQNDTIDLLSPACYLDIDSTQNKATFTDGLQEITIYGESVRLLYIYAMAAQDEDPWISTSEAYETWLAHGGNEQSSVERISWERNKLCQYLEQQNIVHARKLFERKKHGKEWLHRLSILPQNITCVTI